MQFHLLVYCLITLSPLAGTAARADAFSNRYEQAMSHGAVLNAIGSGHIDQLVSCALPIGQPSQISTIDEGVTHLPLAAARSIIGETTSGSPSQRGSMIRSAIFLVEATGHFAPAGTICALIARDSDHGVCRNAQTLNDIPLTRRFTCPT